MVMPEPVIPSDIPGERLPDLLRNWHLGNRARKHLTGRRFQTVASMVRARPRDRVLDVGCGWGYHLFLLSRAGFEPFGVDIVQNDFYAARAIARANAYDPGLVGGDMSALPFASRAFAAVTAVETLEHIFEPDRRAALEEAFRVLAPGGALVLSTPNYHSIVEAGKRVVVRFPFLMRRLPTMCYPTPCAAREAYHPYRYHLPVPRGTLKAMLEEAGFVVLGMRTIIFIWKNVPDSLFPLARFLESILERIPLVRSLGSTLVVLARKPPEPSSNPSQDSRRAPPA